MDKRLEKYLDERFEEWVKRDEEKAKSPHQNRAKNG